MKRMLFATVVCVFAAAIAGCAASTPTTTATAAPQKRAAVAKASPEVHDAIVARVDELLTLAGAGDYDAIKGLILPEQAAGFDGKAFIEKIFRMKISEFEVVAWDGNSIGVTPAKTRGEMLSQVAAYVRVLAINEARPVYINLYWRNQGGKWYIIPYHETE